MTLGFEWAEIFERDLGRKLRQIQHLNLGNPHFQVDSELAGKVWGRIEAEEITPFLKRLNSSSIQASELVWKFDTCLRATQVVLLDTKMLDTAVGQYLLTRAREMKIPAWAVGVDNATSPLAAAFLRGVLYPSTAEDLVKLVVNEIEG